MAERKVLITTYYNPLNKKYILAEFPEGREQFSMVFVLVTVHP